LLRLLTILGRRVWRRSGPDGGGARAWLLPRDRRAVIVWPVRADAAVTIAAATLTLTGLARSRGRGPFSFVSW